MEIVVVGHRDTILGFKTIGLDLVYYENDVDDLINQINNTIEQGAKIFFITESVFVKLNKYINTFFGKPYPIFVPIPEIKGSEGIAEENIRSLVVRALGTDTF
ncbi:MAG TPA: V-type ATP synthase subunit F [Spirochaetota bacterium]|nr:V-type ATP synthase subunit F [Spirochaetota bacterium]HOM37610.1 V-type ATP synthase subunit F [Spirochaetota bacterium]HPQ49419.1 V-type ATP synthase subunit F [Spirochaetota bacterium]